MIKVTEIKKSKAPVHKEKEFNIKQEELYSDSE